MSQQEQETEGGNNMNRAKVLSLSEIYHPVLYLPVYLLVPLKDKLSEIKN